MRLTIVNRSYYSPSRTKAQIMIIFRLQATAALCYADARERKYRCPKLPDSSRVQLLNPCLMNGPRVTHPLSLCPLLRVCHTIDQAFLMDGLVISMMGNFATQMDAARKSMLNCEVSKRRMPPRLAAREPTLVLSEAEGVRDWSGTFFSSKRIP